MGGGADHGLGEVHGDFRSKVWSMSGGPYCRPKHWKRNTAIAMFGVFLICIPIAMKSAELESSPFLTMANNTRSHAVLKDAEERIMSEMDRRFAALSTHLDGVQEIRGQLTELQGFVRQLSIRIADTPVNDDRRRDYDYYTPTRYTKLDFPSFSAADVDAWVAKCERYFSLDGTPEGRKTLLASIALDNDAYRWFQHFERGRNGNVPWDVFVEAVRNRFGPLYEDPIEDLMQLRQTSTLAEYQRAFDNIMCQVDLPEAKRIGCFIGGLKPKVAAGVKLLQPRTLLEASKLARLQEENLESLQRMTLSSFSSQVHQNFLKDLVIDSIPVFEAAMKQDFESLSSLEGQSHDALVLTSVSETQSSPRMMLNAQAFENDCFRMVRGDEVNGSIVYSRQRKARHLFDRSSEMEKFKRLKTSWEPHANVHIPGAEGGGSVELDSVEHMVGIGVSCNTEKPMTVKELFDTGQLDGVSVVCMDGKKASGLRGIIKDRGILCSCCLCNGRRVIPHSQFEIQACKAYKLATPYIYLENGKSLLELLRACKGTPLRTLEAIIQNVVCSPPVEKYFTCKWCKVCFPPSCVERVRSICNSCKESKESQDSDIDEVGKRVRSSRLLPVSKQSNTSEKHMSSQIKRPWKKRTKSPKWVSRAKSSKNSLMAILSRKKNLWRMKKKSSNLSVTLKTTRTTSNSMRLSSPNKSHWRITKKHQQLHELVFEGGRLPDGTKVAYYARGQKLLEGYKKGFGIMCRCCNSEVSPLSLGSMQVGLPARNLMHTSTHQRGCLSMSSYIPLKDRKYSTQASYSGPYSLDGWLNGRSHVGIVRGHCHAFLAVCSSCASLRTRMISRGEY